VFERGSGEVLVNDHSVSSEPLDGNGTLSGGTMKMMSETERFNKMIENQLNI
jgi:hypothetical protein